MADSLKLVSYNVRGMRDDRRALNQVISAINPDVLVLQESPKQLFWRARCQRFMRSLGMQLAAGGMPAHGNLIGVRDPSLVRGTRMLHYPYTPPHQRRGAAAIEYVLGDRHVTIAGTHLSLDRAERARQVVFLLDNLPADAPTVVAGDMNEKPGGAVWAHFTQRFADAAGDDETITFSCANPRRRIDAIFVDPQFTVESYGVVVDEPVSRASDHFPIAVVLR